ncbi:hypothetical protein LF887_01415 [Chryseobacterium sp. MEBOG06]|uniref:hypothetical protein n=1 Tax=Chryseobacterium sp. MEBOG06 TaxID=2879938 RepID=UPI001F1C6B31|nr:hypothetical protein [Chryseobacterium sp. MEBOG06]UKB84341.1 hypothetical protein LF887_01415 [Chryseobacterium sp. MEBOG06]
MTAPINRALAKPFHYQLFMTSACFAYIPALINVPTTAPQMTRAIYVRKNPDT